MYQKECAIFCGFAHQFADDDRQEVRYSTGIAAIIGKQDIWGTTRLELVCILKEKQEIWGPSTVIPAVGNECLLVSVALAQLFRP